LCLFGCVVTDYLNMKYIFTSITLCIYLIAACLPVPTSAPVETSTPSPMLPTATPTIVWFPPTPTFTPFPTIVITPTAEMRPGIGDIIVEDQFDDPNRWSVTSTNNGSIAFGKNEITIAISQDREYLFSIRNGQEFDDFYVEVTANPNLCHAEDEYGMLLRVSQNEDYYRYSLSCDGRVRLDRIYQNQASSPQPWIASGAVPPGAPSISRLGIWASEDEMRFFVNDEYQFTAYDPLLKSGNFGVFARSSSEWAVTVNFSDLVVREINSP
jgi:hypothetical protein